MEQYCGGVFCRREHVEGMCVYKLALSGREACL